MIRDHDQEETDKPRRGGRRAGAGRHPAENPSIWMQLGVMLTDREAEQLEESNLSPAQRRYRLLMPLSARLKDEYLDDGLERRQYNFRIVLEDIEQRKQILNLKVPERRRRLLSVPEGGDIEDDRPSRWQTDKHRR